MIRSDRDKSFTRRIDIAKFRQSNMIKSNINNMSNTKLIGGPFLNQRRSFSTNQEEAIKRLEDMKRDLGKTLTPILKENVVAYKKDPNTIWILDGSNNKAKIVNRGINLYINISTFLISIKTAKSFTRYLNIDIQLNEMIELMNLNDNVLVIKDENYNENYNLNPNNSCKENISDEDKLIENTVNSVNKKLNELIKVNIKSDNYVEYKPRNRYSNVIRELLKDKNLWEEILLDAKNNLEDIIFKVWAVQLSSKSDGAKTPGMDGLSFKKSTILFDEKETASARLYLESIYSKYKKIVSLSKGKNDQVINRKGINNLSKRENLRRYLKSEEGKLFIMHLKDMMRQMKTDPVGFANNEYYNIKKHNNELKFKLCSYIKNNSLKSYKSKGILRVWIPKSNGKLRPLGIPSILDRALQMLLKLVMEAYMEPLGDEFSFGFRPGRNTHQVTSYIHNRLQYNNSRKELTYKERTYLETKMKLALHDIGWIKDKSKPLDQIDPSNNIQITIPGYGTTVRRKQINVPDWLYEKVTEKDHSIIYDTQYIIDADIKGCFDNISHKWLLDNVPMPIEYEYLLLSILKTNIYEEDENIFKKYTIDTKSKYKIIVKSNDNNLGIPQGGIISPLLMNWTLDGLQHFVKWKAHTLGIENNLYSIDRANIMEKLDKSNNIIRNESYYRNKTRIEWYNTTWFVRYADDFLIGVKTEIMANLIYKSLTEFLNIRGLEISEEKSKIIPWKMGNKVDFLGWTHHLIYPKEINWLISTSKHNAGKLVDWIGTYTYPSADSTARFRSTIKFLTSTRFTNLELFQIFKNVNDLIRGWSNYFSPGPKQIHLRRHLDVYVWRRIRKFVMSKYGHNAHDYFIKHFTMEVDKNSSKAFYHKLTGTYRMWLKSPTISNDNISRGTVRKTSINILNLTSLNMPSMWSVLVPKKELFMNSMYLNPTEYIKRAILIGRLRGDSQSKLLIKQKFNCTCCNLPLINWDSLINYNNKEFNEIMNLFYSQSNDKNNTNINEINSNNAKLFTRSKSINILDSRLINWLGDAQIDHIIPKVLAGKSPILIKLLNNDNNLQLIHKHCHVQKTNIDRLFLDQFRKVRKLYLPNKLSTYSETDINKATFNIIIHLYEAKLLNQFDNSIIKQLVSLSQKSLKTLK